MSRAVEFRAAPIRPLTFVLLWIAAGLWFPLLAGVVLPPSSAANGFWPGTLVGWGTLAVAGLTQSLLLIGRVRAPLLWLAAAILADFAGHALFSLCFKLASYFGGRLPDGSVAIAAIILAMTIAVAVAQALAIRYWRLGAWQWLAIALVAHLVANVAALVASPNVLVQTVIQWVVFGGVMGSWLWHCLQRARRGVALA
jgi:hypothetical protein